MYRHTGLYLHPHSGPAVWVWVGVAGYCFGVLCSAVAVGSLQAPVGYFFESSEAPVELHKARTEPVQSSMKFSEPHRVLSESLKQLSQSSHRALPEGSGLQSPHSVL
jgi:hypothetical protein